MSAAISPAFFPLGSGLIDGQLLNTVLAYPRVSTQDGIVAFAGGGQTNATQITAYINRVSSVVTGGDSVKLPPSKNTGQSIVITNATSNALQVFSHGDATINDIAGATGISQTGNSTSIYENPGKGYWYTVGAVETGTFTGIFDGPIGSITPSTGVFTTARAATFNAGADASAGTVVSFPATTASGKLILAAVNSAGAFNTTISNASMAQSTVISIPDPGATTANFLLSKGAQSIAGANTFTGGLTITTANATITDVNIVLGTATGTKFGTASTQKLGFYNATPIVQPATTGTSTGFTAGGGTTATSTSTFTGNSGSTAYTVGDIVLALKTLGFMAA